jgi:hypothetical protein
MAKGEPKAAEGDEVDDPELNQLLEEVKNPLPKAEDEPLEKPVDPELVNLLGASDPLPKEDAPPPVPVQVPVPAPIPAQPVEQPAVDADLKGIIEKFNAVAHVVTENLRDDRDEIEDTIDRLRTIFSTKTDPKGFIVEGLVSALKTKADTTGHAVKLLDALAKIVAATKNTSVFQSTSTTIDIGDLLGNDGEDDGDDEDDGEEDED